MLGWWMPIEKKIRPNRVSTRTTQDFGKDGGSCEETVGRRFVLEEGHFALYIFVEVLLLQIIGRVQPFDGHLRAVVVPSEDRTKRSAPHLLGRCQAHIPWGSLV